MKVIKYCGLFIGLVCLSGCASVDKKQVVEGLSEQLRISNDSSAAVRHKFELAKQENLNLKKEITLFRKSQDIDPQSFIKASEVFQKELKNNSIQDEVRIQTTERGLIVSVLAEKIFMTGTDDLSASGEIFLDKIVSLIEHIFPMNYLYIEGHTDNRSLAVFEWKSDWDFSFSRALSVLKYFTEKKHLDPWRMSASGLGQYRPWATNETKEGRRLNRRIEIIISPQRSRHVEAK